MTFWKRSKVMIRTLAFALFVSCSVLSTSIFAADLHLILLGDLNADDLKNAIKKDLQSIQNEASQIAKYTGLKLKITQFQGTSFKTDTILTALKNLQTQQDDAILFYFSGHGYRTPSKGDDPWPYLYFVGEDKGVDVSNIQEILNAKSAHFILMVTDCCNNVISDYYAPFVVKEMDHAFGEKDLKKSYRKLFVETDGFIAVTSSKAGQTSLCTANGSFYTTALMESIVKETKKNADLVSWQSILDQASYRVHAIAQKYGEKQDPVFTILDHQ